MNQYRPMHRADIENIKELLAKMWMVDRAAFREIHAYMGIVLSSASEHIPQ